MAFSSILVPKQISVAPEIVTIGSGSIFTVAVAEAVQPVRGEPVTEKVATPAEVAVKVAFGLANVEEKLPLPELDHEKRLKYPPPLADKLMVAPTQIEGLSGVTIATPCTKSPTVAELVQLNVLVAVADTVKVYCPPSVGIKVGDTAEDELNEPAPEAAQLTDDELVGKTPASSNAVLPTQPGMFKIVLAVGASTISTLNLLALEEHIEPLGIVALIFRSGNNSTLAALGAGMV